jgi:hypothetical protein
MACSAVMYFQGFFLGGELLSLGFFLTASAMALWFRDCVIEGKIGACLKNKYMLGDLIIYNLKKCIN